MRLKFSLKGENLTLYMIFIYFPNLLVFSIVFGNFGFCSLILLDFGVFFKKPKKKPKIGQNSDKYQIFIFFALTKGVKPNKIEISLLVPYKTITKEELCKFFAYYNS